MLINEDFTSLLHNVTYEKGKEQNRQMQCLPQEKKSEKDPWGNLGSGTIYFVNTVPTAVSCLLQGEGCRLDLHSCSASGTDTEPNGGS